MIIVFENPDVEFLIIDDNYLEVGTDTLFESEFMTAVELNEWANDNDIENDNIEEIIKLKNRFDLENGDIMSSASSRGYHFFQELDFEVPVSLGIELIDGPQPGSDLRSVKLLNKELLPQFQNLLLENHIKANFIMHQKFN